MHTVWMIYGLAIIVFIILVVLGVGLTLLMGRGDTLSEFWLVMLLSQILPTLLAIAGIVLAVMGAFLFLIQIVLWL
ncbi:MAG TPA: hypothetical protein ENF32_03270 [Thermosulfidibacter takaii]|uniref:Uncharacterized protein n=1 Tax=Thermosulfidibacter takaii TaxID=412593 RepID=A0A7C0U6X7_9BACT|nr:hypothetical protein [Thermosulfidibacter takaii]